MKNKKLFNLSAIMVGIVILLTCGKVQATESVFSNIVPTRRSSQAYTSLPFSNSTNLGISKDRESGDSYTWNPNTIGEAKTIWKIATINPQNTRDYSNLYYCLNATRGFGVTNGEMAEGATDDYTNSFDMKVFEDKSNITNYAGGNLGINYNKVLWILDNSYTPIGEDNYQKTLEYIKLMEDSNIEVEADKRLNLTEDEIEAVQQMAIWYFTNSDNSNYKNENLPSLYLNGKELSSIYFYTTQYGEQITGKIRQDKAEKLYQYFIKKALSTYERKEPTLRFEGEILVTESGDNYIVGPYTLIGEKTDRIKEILVTSKTHNYTLLDSSKKEVPNNDFEKVLGESFYLKVSKSEINETTEVELKLKYRYDFRNLTFMTNPADSTNTQPVVLVEDEELEKDLELVVPISVLNVSVEKIWDDNNNQDNVRPSSIKVQLYKDGVAYGDSITLNESKLTHTWTKLLAGYKYTVKELNSSNEVVENGDNYNDEYVATYEVLENKTRITNSYTPEVVKKTVVKIWEDVNNVDEIRPEHIEVQLYKTIDETKSTMGEEYKVTLNEANNWTKTWDNLPAKENGKTIIYSVEEIEVPEGYIVNYSEDTFTITNTHLTNGYSVKLLKVGEDGTTAISGAWFKINDGQATLISQTGTEIATGTISESGDLELEYKLEEITAPEGYVKLTEPKVVKIKAKVELIDNEYQITEVAIQEEVDGVTISEENNVITIKVENKVEVTGKYNIVLRKVDANGNKLEGSKFKVNGTEYDLLTGEVIIYENQQITSENPIDFTYIIEETVVPAGYNGIEITEVNIKAQIQKLDNNYKLIRVTLVDSEGNNITDENISIKLEGDSIVIEVTNTLIEKEFDLSLRKFITEINGQTYFREPVVDVSTISSKGTATYKHTKQPIAVQKGDVVTYTIRVYNEGEVDGYVEMITDHLPDNLLPIIIGTEGIDEEKYEDEIDFNLNWGWIISEDGKTVTTMKTAKSNSDTYSLIEGFEEITDTKLNGYVEGSNELDYIDVQIKCLVTDSAVNGEYLTNIAEITKMCTADGLEVETDIDSTKTNADYSDLSTYKNEEAISSDTNSYIEGQEDDDDFEKIYVKEFDLALRKFIIKVNEKSYSRTPVVDTSKLGTVVDGKTITTATYNHSKETVIVETGDLVTYKIRIYNEGSLAGFANEITDDIPKGLEFLPDSSINVSYRWKMLDSEGKETEDAAQAVIIVTDYLSDINKNNIIEAVSEEDGVKTLSYKDVEVQFKVVAKAEKLKDNLIINEAQISRDSDRDIDSDPNRNEKYDYATGNNEDDIDYEPIKLEYFDLALRKFVTKVNTTDYNNRYPEVIYNEDGSITYNQTKDPVLVTTGDTVIYTIRVYNQGEKAGNAIQIKDNLPEGLEFLPENEINKTYEWKLIDESGNETEDLSKAKKVVTNILENETIEGINKENGHKILSYRDVQIAFKVIEEENSNRILVNTAEISKDSDDDVDSTPDNGIETEDDLDKEYVKVQYFDLSLKKWVTSTKVTYNGKTTTTKTGFDEDSEGIAKVDLVASKMKNTTVKFTYNIKVINEGELPGYAYEIKDYIPNGLKFVQEDNKGWKEVKDGVVVTDKLKDTLLNPGESATVEITLTWKNSTTNLALKTNYAEISSDSGNDIDSTPDNYNKQEDDIDEAQVILSIKTAGATTYVGLVLISVSILAAGIFLIKKYVIR